MSEAEPWKDYEDPVAGQPQAEPWKAYEDPMAPAPTAQPQARPAAPTFDTFGADQPGYDPKADPPGSMWKVWHDFNGQPTVASPTDDKYKQAAIADRNRSLELGIPLDEGYTARAAHGAGLNWTDEALAGLMAVPEMAYRGVGYGEAYNYTKARQDLAYENAQKNTGALGTAAELLGGVGGVGGAAVAATPAKAVGVIPAGVVNYGKGVATGAGVGAIAGAGEGNNLEERASNAELGGVLGGGIGAFAPPILGAAGAIGRGIASRFRSPESIAFRTVAGVAQNSGRDIGAVSQEIADAGAAGQPYTFADALGKEGQRALVPLAKQPGSARETITQALTDRSLGMPQRVGGQIGDALGAPQSAQQATEALIKEAQTKASPVYRAAEDVPTWSDRLSEFYKDEDVRKGLAHGVRLQQRENVGTGQPFNPTDAMITGFNEAGDPIITGVPNVKTLNTAKTGLDRMIEASMVNGRHTADSRSLTILKNNMLNEADAINPTYKEARSIFRGPMEVKDAVRTGREMVTSGRAVDNLQTFNSLTPAEQQGARIGYADAVRAPLEKTGNYPSILREKSAKGADELNTLALPGRADPLRRFLNREETMQQTKNAALGGSSTAENAADMGIDPAMAVSMLTNVAKGNHVGLLANVTQFAKSIGTTSKQRDAIAELLLTQDPARINQFGTKLQQMDEARRGFNPWTGRSRIPAGQ